MYTSELKPKVNCRLMKVNCAVHYGPLSIVSKNLRHCYASQLHFQSKYKTTIFTFGYKKNHLYINPAIMYLGGSVIIALLACFTFTVHGKQGKCELKIAWSTMANFLKDSRCFILSTHILYSIHFGKIN